MFQTYYQIAIRDGIYLEPALSYIPNPGERPGISAVWAATLNLVVLF